MEHIEKVAERILKLSPGASPANAIIGTSVNIKYFIMDVCKMLKNIRDTSFSESDKLMRLERLSKETGIEVHDLKQAC